MTRRSCGVPFPRRRQRRAADVPDPHGDRVRIAVPGRGHQLARGPVPAEAGRPHGQEGDQAGQEQASRRHTRFRFSPTTPRRRGGGGGGGLSPLTCLSFQGGRPRVSAEEEGVREMSGKPRGCSGKPEQDSDRGAENVKGPLLRENGMSARRGGGRGAARRARADMNWVSGNMISARGPFCFLPFNEK